MWKCLLTKDQAYKHNIISSGIQWSYIELATIYPIASWLAVHDENKTLQQTKQAFHYMSIHFIITATQEVFIAKYE